MSDDFLVLFFFAVSVPIWLHKTTKSEMKLYLSRRRHKSVSLDAVDFVHTRCSVLEYDTLAAEPHLSLAVLPQGIPVYHQPDIEPNDQNLKRRFSMGPWSHHPGERLVLEIRFADAMIGQTQPLKGALSVD